MRLIIVSGQSGAGKSVALRVLEDLGYYCVDNLPVDLLDAFLQSVHQGKQNIAVSLDIRNLPQDPTLLLTTIQSVKSSLADDVSILFLDATQETLLKRYSETRRIHPLSLQKHQLTLAQAIDLEKDILVPLKEHADLTIDSTNKSIHALSETIRMRVEGRERKSLVMVFQSFGFKYGLPKDTDFVFDVRFLPNPHWQPELRPQTGLDAPVKAFLEHHPEVMEMKHQLQLFVEYWLPLMEKNNRSYLTVSIGCTGGKHRSVYLTQQIGEYFSQLGHQVQIRHKSLEMEIK
ncbi:glmZ(sRNA)-inactivating NTPase [Vibrio aerogenes CECT 7868]|uniref:GlmZ(SRNA)-inactivating NTPase n=1 Tax=Vibrio aerogenes CECT 7868 TaxID=1216006 RepID=A0A1M5XIX2_9VIBR|nr:RNase adapter RapZ [Vibrio aerogenes]SHH99706.1 glmZ(sRNA)-inactivating NTPase [Vibrio aerogenes CECT 7868]